MPFPPHRRPELRPLATDGVEPPSPTTAHEGSDHCPMILVIRKQQKS
jgi:hypothetical protein